MCENTEGFGKTARIDRLTWAYDVCLSDKYPFLMDQLYIKTTVIAKEHSVLEPFKLCHSFWAEPIIL